MKGPLERVPWGSRETMESSRSLSKPTVLLGTLAYYLSILFGLAIILVPILIVIAISFNPTEAELFPPNGFSLRWYFEFFQIGEVTDTRYSRFFPSFFYMSLPVAIVVGCIATILGVLAAYTIVRAETRFTTELQTFVLAPLIFPSVIIGLALLLFFIRIDISRMAYLNLIIGHTLVALPYSTLISAASLYSVNEDLEMAARNMGANKYQTFLRVTLPLMKSGVVASFLLAFMISFSDINIALFVGGGNEYSTLPQEIFLFLRFDSSPIIAAAATLSIVLVMILITIVHMTVGFKTVVDET